MQLDQFVGLQQAIDSGILGESWDKVKSLLEDYTAIFESSLDPQQTKPLKCYFCVSSAELFFHGNNDLASSIDSLRRGFAFDNENKHLRIVAMRILLITCKAPVNFFSSRHDSTQHYRHISYKGGDLSLASSLGDRQREIPLEIVSKIDSILRYFTKIERCCIISILETFPITIVAEVLKGYYHKLLSMGKSFTDHESKKDFVLSIAQYFIPQYTNIPDIFDLYMSGQITAYNYWTVLDSILMRATIAETLGDLGTATTLLQLVVDFHGRLDPTLMEEHCLDQILLCVSKLPLLYAKKGQFDLSAPFFHNCIYDDGFWSGYLPMKVRVGLSIKAALCSINHGKSNDFSGISRDSILRAGEYLAFIWSKLRTDKPAFIDALSQSSFSSRSLHPLKISGINVLPDDDTNIPFIATNFDVSGVGVLLAGLIHYAFLYLDMRLTPSIILSKDYEETFLSFDVHAVMHEVIEWGYQLSLKPSLGAIWNMATSCLLHTEDPQRAGELLYLAHQQVVKNIQHYLSEHEIKTNHLSPMETARLYIDALHHITSIEDHELGKGLTTLSFHIPQRYLEDPWASLVKYSEITISHVCAVTNTSYHQTGFSDHWSPTTIELESAIQHLIDGIHRFGGNLLWEDIIQRHIGIVRGHFTHTLQSIMHDQPLQEGISKQQLLVHGLHSFYQHGIEGLLSELKVMVQAVIDNQLFAFSVSSIKSNEASSSVGPVNDDYSAALGLLTLLLQLGRLLFHYAQHSSLTERMRFSLQKMSLKLVHIVVTMIEPFVNIPLPGTIHDEGFSKFNSAQNILAHNNSRYVEYIEVKITANFYLAMLYLDLRLPQLASKVAREVLQSPVHHTHRGWMKLELRFLHLLCLSVSASDEGDDPKKLALAIALIQKVIGTGVLFGTSNNSSNNNNTPGHDPSGPPVLPAPIDALYLNERYTILLLILQSGERRLATTVCERLVQDMHLLLQRYEYEEAHHQQRAQDPSNNVTAAAEHQASGNNTSNSCNSKNLTFSKVPFFITMLPDVAFQNDTMVKLVQLLRQVAQVAVQLDRLTLAKQAVGIAWKALYTVDAATAARLKTDAENNPPPSTFIATQAAQSQPINTMMNIIQPKSLEQLAKTHEEIDALRYLPTLLGWRLPEGYGWGLEHHRDLEAALLCTCARILQQETGKIDDPKAISLLHLALSHDANHVETLNALANVSLALYERDVLRKGNPTLSMDCLHLLHAEGGDEGGGATGDEQRPVSDNQQAATSSSRHQYHSNNASFYVKEELLLHTPRDAQQTTADTCTAAGMDAFLLQTHDQDLLDVESSYAFLSEHFPQLASPHLAAAMFYVRSALAVQERCADSWQLMSAITRALQQGEFSEEAAITALECQVHLPVRRSCVALW